MNRTPTPRPRVVRNLIVRAATPKDVRALVQLAASLNENAITAAALKRDVLGRNPAVHVLVAVLDGSVVAAAFYVRTYDVPSATRGLFVNYFLISAQARARDVGSALTSALAALCKKHGGAFLHWASDPWAVDAHDAYRRIGATDVPVMAHAIAGTKFVQMAKAGAGFLTLKKR